MDSREGPSLDGPADPGPDGRTEVSDGGKSDGNLPDTRDVANTVEAAKDDGRERAGEAGEEVRRDARGEVGIPMLKLLAGQPGGPGNEDGVGTAARFNNPSGIATDGAGNLFVADSANHLIRQIAIATGVVTTLAGSPVSAAGSADGTRADARFTYPRGVASDGAGNLFVADTFNHTIRKIVIATAAVTTLAGLPGTSGSADGTGSAANFNAPRGVVCDGNGNLFVADADNGAIRKVVIATRVVTTLAGSPGEDGNVDGIGTAARFFQPRAVTSDGAGNLFVADYANSTIRKIVISTGAVTTLAGTPGSGSADGIGAGARFSFPEGLAWDGAGNLFVADTNSNTIRKVVISSGAVTTLAGAPGDPSTIDGAGPGARFAYPSGVVSGGAGNLFVSDGSTVRKVVVATGEVTTLAGLPGVSGSTDGTGSAARFAGPQGIASDGSGSLFVADTYNHTIRQVEVATEVVTTLAGFPERHGSANGTGSAANFYGPEGVASDGAGRLFVADTLNHTIRQIDIATGTVTSLAGSAGSYGSTDGTGSTARFLNPTRIAYDGTGNLFVTEAYNCTIRRVVVATGAVTTFAGVARISGSTDGTGTDARFMGPMGVASDGAGNLFVVDAGAHTVRKIVIATRDVTTIAGSPENSGYVDGTGSNARFYSPVDVVSDGVGNLFVSDQYNQTVRKVVIATGTVTTVVGTLNHVNVIPGPLPAKLARPSGLAVGPTGDLFITDQSENVVLLAQF